MSRRPWYPMFPADYKAKTADLTNEQNGIYRDLLDLAWLQPEGTLPNDMRFIRGNLRWMDVRVFNRLVPPLLSRFFVLNAHGQWENRRLSLERTSAELRSDLARSSANKRWAKVNEINALAHAKAHANAMLSTSTDKNITLSSLLNSEPRARKKAVAEQASNPSPTPQETAMPKDSAGTEITNAMRKASQRALAERDTRTQPPDPKLDPLRIRTKEECQPSPHLDQLVRQQNRTRGIPPDPTATSPHIPRKPGSIPVSGELEAIIQRWREEGLLNENDQPQKQTKT